MTDDALRVAVNGAFLSACLVVLLAAACAPKPLRVPAGAPKLPDIDMTYEGRARATDLNVTMLRLPACSAE